MSLKRLVILLLILFLGIQTLWADEGGKSVGLKSMLGGGGSNSSAVQTDEFSGAATYSIPINVPPGRGSVTPQLGLSYNSYRRNINSWLGYGWEMEMGSIARVRPTISNGSDGIIDFVEGKEFEIRQGGEAESLVLMASDIKPSSYGVQGMDQYPASLYQARIEGAFTYYLALRQADSQLIIAWIAIDKSGTRYFFGWDDESREKVGAEGISRWMLTKVQDANGQQLNIFYSLLLPVTISYADVVITFAYKTNADGWGEVTTFPFYQFGNPTWVSMSRLLDEINIQASGKLLQHYQFHYVLDKIKRRLLSQITQTAGDGKSLPPITLNYQADFNPSLSETKFIHNKWGSPDYDGTLYEQAAFADMNGDGLVDHVIAKPEGGMDVFYNDGNNFFYRPGQSFWPEPFDCKYSWGGGSPTCKGKINGYHDDHQFLFLMDINGDGLPDRVARYYDGPTNGVEISYFRIAFNTGKGWSAPVDWKDPYEGDWAGVSLDDKGFYDMNGDGLVDRVVGNIELNGQKGFNVYLNTGAGFKNNPFFWVDPLNAFYFKQDKGTLGNIEDQLDGGSDNPALGKLYASDGENMYSFIRDFNGDGLPDRFFAVNILDKDDKILAKGTVIFLNQNGQGWAQGVNSGEAKLTANGTTVLLIADAVDIDYDQKGFINKTQDWIDVNGDGFLDRVHGVPDTGAIWVNYYQGIKSSEAWSSFKSEIMQDTLEETNNDHKVRGYLNNHLGDHDQYVFFQDFNGDGLPDRLAVAWDAKGKPIEYQLRVMENEPITFSDTPSWWANKNISQPYGALTQVDDGRSHKTAIEYQPSTWPRYKGQSLIFNLQLNQRPNHRYLPFNLNVAHKLYTQDYTVGALGGILGTIPEAKRHPGMRWVTYDYEGGYYYFRGAIKKIQNNLFDDKLYQVRIARFEGFQSVKKTPWRPDSETWNPYTTETRFHQALGAIDPTAGKNDGWFDPAGYTHDSLAGRPYRTEIKEGKQTVSLEETTWQVKDPLPNDNFYCLGIICEVHPASLKKTVWNDPNQPPRGSRVDYQYDQYGNPTQEDHYSLAGDPLITLQTDYYPPNKFQALYQMRNRPMAQRKRLGDTTYREKSFQYDSVGNPIEENLSTVPGGGEKLTVKRSFWGSNLTSLTDVDGVKKNIGYDAGNLFPIKETVLGAGQALQTTRTFDRLTGEITSEVNASGIGHLKEFDGLGRVTSESIRDSKGNVTKVKSYQYDYFPSPIGTDVNPTTVLKVTTYKYQTSNVTIGIPEQMSYLDPSGKVLQNCQLSERGDYRMIQSKIYNGGRDELTTEPIFTKYCPFIATFPANAPSYHELKDLQGRTILKEPPAGDANSPTGKTVITYTQKDNGQLVRKTANAKGQTLTETLDDTDRLIAVQDNDGNVLNYSYNSVGDLLSVTHQGQVLTAMTYDVMGRRLSMTDADMGNWIYHYDAKGNLTEQIDAKGQKVSHTYDGLGRVTKKEFYQGNGALDGYEEYSYDQGSNIQPGELAQVSEYSGAQQLKRWTKFGYEPLFRRQSTVERFTTGLGLLTQTTEYDTLGKVTKLTYPGGQQIAFQYMATDQLMKVCDKACIAGNEIYYQLDPQSAFDAFGSLQKETYGNGVVSDYSYYPNSHRLLSKKLSNNGEILTQREYTHDLLSNITQITDQKDVSPQGGSLAGIQYDSLNRLSAYQGGGAKDGASLSYAANGNILKNNASFGNTPYEYNSARPHAVTKIGDQNFTYDANGNLASDTQRQFTYNARNQLIQVTLTNGTQTHYDYDYAGVRVLKKVETDTTHYWGDALEIHNQKLVLNLFVGERKIATRVIGDLGPLSGNAGAGLLDTGIKLSGELTPLLPWILLFLAWFSLFSLRPTPDLIPSWAYVRCIAPWRRGELFPGGPRTTVSMLRLIQKVQGTFAGPEGNSSPRRLHQTLIHTYHRLYDHWRHYQDSLWETFIALPQRTASKALCMLLIMLGLIQTPVLLFAGQPIAPIPDATDANYFYYVHDDHLGSSQILTEGKVLTKHSGLTYQRGQVLQRFEYTPFGQERYVQNATLNLEPSFTGQKYDKEAGLYFYKSRYYDPHLGRFLQPDSVIPDGSDLQAYNRYSYVRNNPLNFTDPTGHFWEIFKNIFGALLGGLVAGFLGALLSPIIGPLAAAMLAGMAGGLITGAITGGLEGALTGAIIGLVSGGLGFVGNMGLQTMGIVKQGYRIAILAGLGALASGVKYGWQGVLLFGVGFLGAYAGSMIGTSVEQAIRPDPTKNPTPTQKSVNTELNEIKQSPWAETPQGQRIIQKLEQMNAWKRIKIAEFHDTRGGNFSDNAAGRYNNFSDTIKFQPGEINVDGSLVHEAQHAVWRMTGQRIFPSGENEYQAFLTEHNYLVSGQNAPWHELPTRSWVAETYGFNPWRYHYGE